MIKWVDVTSDESSAFGSEGVSVGVGLRCGRLDWVVLLSAVPCLLTMSGENSPLLSADSASPERYGVKPYSSQLCFAMMLNYVIGTGCFGLPYAFAESGFGEASLMLAAGGILATLSMVYALEVMARADGVANRGDKAFPENKLSYEKFDFATIAKMFQGIRGRFSVQAVIYVYCSGVLWSYSSVFGSSMASILFSLLGAGECDVYATGASATCTLAYHCFLVVFSVIVMALVLTDVSEQAGLQQFLTFYRIIALCLMLTTIVVRMISDPSTIVTSRLEQQNWFRFDKIGKAFGPCFLALNCHFNLPDAMQPLRNKGAARTVGVLSMMVTIGFYFLLAILGALAFENISPLASLNWSSYTGCGGGWDTCPNDRPNLLGELLKLVVLLFPVINVTSAFPLVGITMGDNLAVSFSEGQPPSTVVRTKAIARLVCIIPPILLAAFFKKLDMILSISGLFGFLLEISIPSALFLASEVFIRTNFGVEYLKNEYSMGLLSHPWLVRFILVSGFVGLAVSAFTITS